MDGDQLQGSLTEGPHKFLLSLVGSWQGTTRTWFEPGKLADESTTQGTMRSYLGDHFIIHEYCGTLLGQPQEGMAVFGYNLVKDRFEAVWFDNLHNGSSMMFSTSSEGVDAKTTAPIAVTGSYYAPGVGQTWFWRTEIELIDQDHLVITAYNILPTGEEAKAIETRYSRVK